MPVVVRDFEVVQEAPPPQPAAPAAEAQTKPELDSVALERALGVRRARALRTRAY